MRRGEKVCTEKYNKTKTFFTDHQQFEQCMIRI